MTRVKVRRHTLAFARLADVGKVSPRQGLARHTAYYAALMHIFMQIHLALYRAIRSINRAPMLRVGRLSRRVENRFASALSDCSSKFNSIYVT